jgi:ubiquinone/menaquinone biosynthesis C-methylase UbiE
MSAPKSNSCAAIRPYASYSKVAAEYYDVIRHPTCRNFRDASKSYLTKALAEATTVETCLEVGVGRSLVAEFVQSNAINIEQLFLLDSSHEMLSYSKSFSHAAQLVVGDARELPFKSESISLVVASLGDPYNFKPFWNEIFRCLEFGAKCLFTTPSYEWAATFRTHSEDELQEAAFFVLDDGQKLYLPSIIKSEAEQKEMMLRAGLTVTDVTYLSAQEIPKPHSSKLFGCTNIVTGYTALKT